MTDRPKVSLNGAIAYRDGATLEDNPFIKEVQITEWEEWRRQFVEEQNRRVGSR